MKKILTSFLIFLVVSKADAQNLFANAGFEELNTCTEIKQQCSPEAWFNIRPVAPPRINPSAVPRPFSGADLLILPVENIYYPIKSRPFIYTMLLCPLEKGKNYRLSFYLNTAGRKFYGVDFCFRDYEFFSGNASPDSLNPSVHISGEDVVDSLSGWKFIETVYTAKGSEKFCLVGNLSKDVFRFSPGQRMNTTGDVFYFIDDILFSPIVPAPPCNNYAEIKSEMYAQDLRHTERALIQHKISGRLTVDTLTNPAVFFETDKSVLKPSFRKLLDSLVSELNSRKVVSVKIEGHTDDRNSNEYNETLSNARAASVKNYVLLRAPAFKTLISSEGKGEGFPKADNRLEKGRAVNRRVEIILTYYSKSE